MGPDRAPHRAQRVSVVFDRRGDAASSEEWKGWRVGNLRPSFEPILWFTKPYKIGTTIADNALNYGVGPYNEEAFLQYVESPDNVLNCGFGQGEGGLHPTQKPVRLMQALIELTTKPDQIVLDPFAGSGSTLVAARKPAPKIHRLRDGAEIRRGLPKLDWTIASASIHEIA